MKIITNEKLIKRNGSIGGWLLGLAALLMGGGVYINLTQPTASNLQYMYLMLAAFIVGYILMLIGLYLQKRFGGIPRPDEKLNAALKGLTSEYTIYHFKTTAPHLLTGPSGIWVLMPYHQRGLATYANNRWRLSKGGFAQAYMTIFGLEGIGRPNIEAENEIETFRKFLSKQVNETDLPEINALLVFTNDNITIDATDSPFPAMKSKNIKEFIRQKAKEKPITRVQLAAVKAALPE